MDGDCTAGLSCKAHPLSFSSSTVLAPLTDFTHFVHLTHLLGSEGIIMLLVAAEAEEIARHDGKRLSSKQQEVQAWEGTEPQCSHFCASLYLSF